MDLGFAFHLGQIVERVGSASDDEWGLALSGEPIRWQVIERAFIESPYGTGRMYRCAGFSRNGGIVRGETMFHEIELRAGEPFKKRPTMKLD
jgi:hypothetical protein